jgi:diguanylate cyclase (GGDEF)-like protein
MGRSIFNSKLSFILLKNILLISGLLTVLLTSVQLLITYQDRKESLMQFVVELEKAQNPSIAKSVLEFHYNNTQAIIDGIRSYEAIGYVAVTASNTQEFEELKAGVYDSSRDSYILKAPLVSNMGETTFNLGMVTIQTAPKYLYKQVKSSFYVILISQGIKTFIVSVILLSFFYRFIINRISTIHKWLASYSPDNEFEPIIFDKVQQQKDEIDELKDEINIVGKSLRKHNKELESLVESKTIELKKANRELEKLAFTDSLTCIDNRASFFQKAEHELKRSRRLSYNLGLMMLDLDHFKLINDNFGHDAGDEVLKMVSKVMNDCLRCEDTLGRVGGEEFAIIVPGTDKSGMHNLAERLQASIGLQDFSFLAPNKKITVSIGYTKVKENEIFKSALKRADIHLYSAKNSGRNKFVTDKEFIPSIVV